MNQNGAIFWNKFNNQYIQISYMLSQELLMYLKDPANKVTIHNNQYIINGKFGTKVFTMEGH